MSYCPECGVEIGNAKRCPLCGTLNPKACEKENAVVYSVNDQKNPEEETLPQEKPTILWEILSVTLAIAMLVLGAIDLLNPGDSRGLSTLLHPFCFYGWN